MLRLLEFFGGKNSSPIFSKLVRARDSNPFILLVGTIKPYILYYLAIFAKTISRQNIRRSISQGKNDRTGKDCNLPNAQSMIISTTVRKYFSNIPLQRLF